MVLKVIVGTVVAMALAAGGMFVGIAKPEPDKGPNSQIGIVGALCLKERDALKIKAAYIERDRKEAERTAEYLVNGLRCIPASQELTYLQYLGRTEVIERKSLPKRNEELFLVHGIVETKFRPVDIYYIQIERGDYEDAV